MAALPSCFQSALTSIEPSKADKENAPIAHADVRAVLQAADALEPWSINPVLIGSYKRSVSIRRVYDVDVFCRMESIDDDVSGSAVLDEFFTVLDGHYGRDADGKRRVTRQARSLQVAFPDLDGLYVDVVPARERADGYWEIPERNEVDWQATNPEELTALKTAMNAEMDELYVPSVKLLRQTRRTILGSRPGGLFVELAFFDACRSGRVQYDNQTLAYVSGLEAIADHLDERVDWGTSLSDPTMPGTTLQFRATDAQWESARTRFRSAAEDARSAYEESDPGRAALIFRKLLGENGDGEVVFPMPAGYDDDGSKKASFTPILPGDQVVPAGNRRFG